MSWTRQPYIDKEKRWVDGFYEFIEEVLEDVEHSEHNRYIWLLHREFEKVLNDQDDTYYFDEEAADRALRIITKFSMTKGRESGAAFENYIAPWQISVIAATFGFKNRETGFRRYKQLNVFVARKNGKSFLGSAIGAYIYAFEKEGGCEVYSVATNAKQAEIVFNTAKTMLMRLTRQSKKLNASLDIRSKEIKKHDDPEASMRYLPSEASRLDGLNPVAVVIDECHELNSEIYEVIISGMGARDEPLLIMTSTAGFRVGGWYHETVKMHKKIVDGVLRQDDVLAYLFTIDVDDGTDPDPKDEAKWIWANPSMVHAGTPKPSYMQERLTQAKNARSFPPFMTKNLNVFITGGNTWMSSADWKQCHDEDLDKSTLIGERCFLGLDLSLNRDLTCLSYYFPDRDVLLVESFLPYESIIMWETKINAPYHQFSEDGWLEATAYPKTDFDLIRRRIEQAHDLYKVGCVAYDRWKASQLVEGLKAAGMTVEAIAMDAKTMSPLIDRFEQKVVTKELRHDGNPLMEWCLAQAQVKVNGYDQRFIVKEDKHKNKIDAVWSSLISFGGWWFIDGQWDGSKESVYTKRDILIL